MEQNYSIDDILSAVNEIQNRNRNKNNKKQISTTHSIKKDYSDIPKHTLKLIQEAEKTK